ncbi:MAG TPA: VWA domain-containing protein [Candidatus Limnocylindrales bacterium]|nr:VWA domain-containing protein [Candidatus Limnocylindrales bacterium]
MTPRDRGLGGEARFRAWDGSQDVPDLTADEIVDALADDLLEHGDLAEALRDLMDRGVRSDDPSRGDMRGLRDLLDRLRERRREALGEGALADPLADVRRTLDEIVAQERAGVQRRLDETDGSPAASDPELGRMLRGIAGKRLDSLDALPPDVGGRVRALQDYDFLDGDARRRFEELVEQLRRSMLDRLGAGLADAVTSMKPEDLQPQRAMVQDLNRLLEQRARGEEPSQAQVDEFLARHGAFFPGARTLDDVIEQLADRMAAMQSLMRSLTPEQRAELQDTLDALLRDDRLKWDLAQLAANLDQVLPGGLGERVRFTGDEPLGLDAALRQLERLQALDALEAQLDGAGGPGDLGAIDRREVGELLGPDAARDLDALEDLADRLEQAGYLERDGDRLELTPRGHRRIGQKVLDELFARLDRDAFGGHRLDHTGRGGEREETPKPFEFGDPFHLDLRATLSNALMREENAPARRAAAGTAGVRLDPGDFEVFRTERTTSASTVLLIDMSRSMLLRNCYLAAKKVAIALDTLIRTQFPRDSLAIVGFAYYARELRPEALAELSWHTYEYGTNLQHGLLLARRILARSRSANKEIVVITDGEPTAHFENGQVEFSYPPTRRTIQETLSEVVRCTKEGITINTFMLERTPALQDFIGYVTELNRGRAFYAEPENLGEYVLVDFVRRRGAR